MVWRVSPVKAMLCADTRVAASAVVWPYDGVVPYSTCDVAGSFVVHVMVAPVFEMLPEATAEITGAVVSSTIVLVADGDQLPTASLNCAYTVLLPAPVVSVHAFAVAYASGVLKDDALFEKRI